MDPGFHFSDDAGDRLDEESAATRYGLEARGRRPDAHGSGTTSEVPDCYEDATDQSGDETGEAQVAAGGGEAGPGPLKQKMLNYNRFIDESLKGLEPMTAVVWLVLFRFARGGGTWASQKTIAERMGVDPKTVMRHLKILKKKQLVRVVKPGTRARRANTYQLGILPLEKRPKAKRSSPRKPR